MAIFKIMKQVEDRIPSTHNRPVKEWESRRSAILHNGHTYPTPASPLHRQDNAAPTTNGTSLCAAGLPARLPVPLRIQ